ALSVEAPRPLAAALELLARRHGLTICYEDPAYSFAGDLDDVTEKVRRDLDRYPPGQAPRVLVPRKAALALRYPAVPGERLADPAAVLQRLIDAHAAADNPGRFRLLLREGRFLVVPLAVRDGKGELVDVGPVLDTRITLPGRVRTGYEAVEEVLAAASEAARVRISPGLAPLRLLDSWRGFLEADREPARDILLRAFTGVEAGAGGRKLVWQLFYDPGQRWYFLNMTLAGEPAGTADPAGKGS
ncbi:MAG TPA: hypothetical protein VE685_27140, partial [Thermoanaerobaculia bacterium]|nr:hypothetical protein [Thermoanaerobaculia bacterium]